MDKLKLQYKRKKKGRTCKDMGKLIGRSDITYRKKEAGEIKFTPEEIVIVSQDIELTRDEISQIFFDGNLPDR